MWRHNILMVICGLWCGLGYLSCEHCSGLPVMSSTCHFLPKAKDVLIVRWLLLREKWHKPYPNKKCSASVVIERVVEYALLYHSLLLMYPCAAAAQRLMWVWHTVELCLRFVCKLGLLLFLLCFLWVPWTATCWKTGSCSLGGWPLSSM